MHPLWGNCRNQRLLGIVRGFVGCPIARKQVAFVSVPPLFLYRNQCFLTIVTFYHRVLDHATGMSLESYQGQTCGKHGSCKSQLVCGWTAVFVDGGNAFS